VRRDALSLDYPREWWFPERGASTNDAKRVCGRCAVRVECLQYALNASRSQRHLGRYVTAGTAPAQTLPARRRGHRLVTGTLKTVLSLRTRRRGDMPDLRKRDEG
jgi:hypothetical protein